MGKIKQVKGQKAKGVPKFKSAAEEAKFWETHSPLDYPGYFKEISKMKRREKRIEIRPACEYPSQWDDLPGPDNTVIATIYTVKEGAEDDRKPGIVQGKDGVYDIVVRAKEINMRLLPMPKDLWNL